MLRLHELADFLRRSSVPPHGLRLRRPNAMGSARWMVVVIGSATLAAGAAAQPAPDGKKVFSATCAACHQANGEGVPERYPPLAGSEWVTGDDGKLVRIVLHGLTGEVEVQGEVYSGAMPPWGPTLNDVELAAVLTYVRASFGNRAAPVTASTVADIRAATKPRTTPWTAAELAKVLSVKK